MRNAAVPQPDPIVRLKTFRQSLYEEGFGFYRDAQFELADTLLCNLRVQSVALGRSSKLAGAGILAVPPFWQRHSRSFFWHCPKERTKEKARLPLPGLFQGKVTDCADSVAGSLTK